MVQNTVSVRDCKCIDILILKIKDYLSQLMYKLSILYRYVCCPTAGGPVYWRAGSFETGQYTHCAGRKPGRAKSILSDFADGAFLSNFSFYSEGTAGITIIYNYLYIFV